uniref:acyl-CoA dehydratase activase n=1 Tax=uncultured Draconibacterium sp. TaxID=1573823 RepID=UPI003216AF01
MKTYSLGIDIGYSAVKIAIIDNDNTIAYTKYQAHKGQTKEALELIFMEIDEKFKISEIIHGAITGSLGKEISQKGLVKRINEAAAAIEGILFLNPKAKSIIEIGGQSAKYYTGFNSKRENAYRISKSSLLKISSNSDCAAGTGSFLEEQASRLNIRTEDYSQYVKKAKSIPRIAGRCSVFAKTDIIHNQQEGVPSEDILKGVAYAIVKNYKGAVMRRLPVETPILFIGGVGNNQAIVDAFKDVLDKSESELIVPQNFDVANAIGAALIAKKDGYKLSFRKMFWDFLSMEDMDTEDTNKEKLPPLCQIETENISQKHETILSAEDLSNLDCFLGIDVGSTSTNLVLMNFQKEIISYKYIRSAGNPVKAVQKGFNEIYVEWNGKINISGVGITGSGRHLIGNKIEADIIKDEITAQAKAAMTIDPEVDTIFEIGGQDSKYISINNGTVIDFQMNKVCAAGTGSFLDEQAQKFNIPVDELGQLAMKGENPVSLGERCTVFIESSIASNLSKGKKTEDIVAGLCYSIAKNYLHRVVGQKKIGNRIFLQGGIAYNQGVANALKVLTQKEIQIPPFFSVTGAYGAALLAMEEMEGSVSKFKGFQHFSDQPAVFSESIEKAVSNKSAEYKKQIEKLSFDHYNGIIDESKKTIGIPRSLFSFCMFPMFNTVFKELGLNVLLSEWSNDDTIKLGQEYSLEETCFPIKLVIGHVAELVGKGVDYILFPKLYNISKPSSKSRQSYGCAYMQLASTIIGLSMELEKRGIELIAPTFAFNRGEEFMAKSFVEIGKQLGKTSEETRRALQKGMEANQRFETMIAERKKKRTEKIDKDKISFVIISKMYGVSDPVLNLGIPSKLIQMGYPVIPFFELPQGDIFRDHPNMFWPFGENILGPARFVRDTPNLYGILLTHHGCGPDSVLNHYFKEIMGDKPYLNIEIDEHASKVGVATRLEAFVNSLKFVKTNQEKNLLVVDQKKPCNEKVLIKERFAHLPSGTKVCIPNMFPYSDLLKEAFALKGIKVEVLPQTNAKSVSLGRRFTMTNEYYSLTSLLGDCFTKLENRNGDKKIAFLMPQTEGAEVSAQYNRLLQAKLTEGNYPGIHVLAPFLEDILRLDKADSLLIFRCLIAGDMIRVAPPNQRGKYLKLVKILINDSIFDSSNLQLIAQGMYAQLLASENQKKVLAIGEPIIVFNDFLNDFTFKSLENQNHKVVYFSFAEAMWMFWNDFVEQDKGVDYEENVKLLSDFRNEMKSISEVLKEESPFAGNIDDLVKTADKSIGCYAGAFARYRQAKALNHPPDIDGIITANSTYENTGVGLNILNKGSSDDSATPILNLSFDGNTNENDRNKVESFIYYL